IRDAWEPEEKVRGRLAKLGNKIRRKFSTVQPVLHTPDVPFHNRLPDSRKTVENMMDRVHMTMKSVRPPRRAKPYVPPPAPAPVEVPPKPARSSTKLKRKNSRRIRGGGSSSVKIAKLQPLLFNAKTTKGSATPQTRIREVMQQKNVLESMLMQHKKLQRDRHTIALDIQRMRADLDRIRTKLDTSLQSLNSTRTIFSSQVASAKTGKARNAIQKKINQVAAVVSQRRRSAQRARGKTSNALPLNANKSSALKRRNR
ncbi:hypothetical protein KR018_011186, partial [Drosophila ironensis]